MIIVGITDIHGELSSIHSAAKALSAADLVLVTGDITHFGGWKEAVTVMDAVRGYNPEILAVSGNCDYKEVDHFLDDVGINLHRKHITIRGTSFFGIGGSLRFRGQSPNENSEEELAQYLSEATEKLLPHSAAIMISHQPPFMTKNDLTYRGIHVGSRSVRKIIECLQPMICFTGHIHEAVGIDNIGGTKIVNPGPVYEGSFSFAKIGKGVEILEIRSSSMD